MFKKVNIKGDEYLVILNLSGLSFAVNYTKNKEDLEYLTTNYRSVESSIVSGNLCLVKVSPSSFILINLENDSSIKLNLTEMSELRSLVR